MQPLTPKLPQVLRRFFAVIQDVNVATLPAHVALRDNVSTSAIMVSTSSGPKAVQTCNTMEAFYKNVVSCPKHFQHSTILQKLANAHLVETPCDHLPRLHICAFAAEHSSSAGVLIQDKLQLLDGGFPVVFGCETRETGEIFSQEADGIMGLGKSAVSVVNQVSCSAVKP